MIIDEYERRVMASPLRVVVTHPVRRRREPSGQTEAAWRAVSDEFDAVDRALSRFRPDSEATLPNLRAGDGTWVAVGDRMYRALAAAHRAWRATAGLFDPRVLDDLERLGYRGAPISGRGRRPAEGDRHVDRWLDRDPRARRVRLAAPVDLGGIGKGLAVRWAFQRLIAALRDRAGTAEPAAGWGAMVDAGGDIALTGPSP